LLTLTADLAAVDLMQLLPLAELGLLDKDLLAALEPLMEVLVVVVVQEPLDQVHLLVQVARADLALLLQSLVNQSFMQAAVVVAVDHRMGLLLAAKVVVGLAVLAQAHPTDQTAPMA
jgi:hypothetical protein